MKVFAYVLAILMLREIVDTADKVRYMSLERPLVVDYNRKYLRQFNISSRRRGRSDPFYYVEMHGETVYSVDNNVTVEFIFYEFLSNEYRRSFVEMRFKACDAVHHNFFFGNVFKQGRLAQPCPFPAGPYHFHNMTVPIKNVPQNFPFIKGRMVMTATATYTGEHIARCQLDMEIKEIRLKTALDKH